MHEKYVAQKVRQSMEAFLLHLDDYYHGPPVVDSEFWVVISFSFQYIPTFC